MKEYEKLSLDIAEGNIFQISKECGLVNGRITIKGQRNKVIIGTARMLKNLVIDLSGNDKEIIIESTSKNIVGLKIVSIRGDKQKVIIGTNFGCGGCEIQMNDGSESISIGSDCLISWGIKMRTSDGHSVIDLESGRAVNLPKDIHIGNHVWVGEDAKFLKGAIIPNNSVVGSFSIVTRPFTEENCVIAGFPAKVIKKNISWDRKMPYQVNRELDSRSG